MRLSVGFLLLLLVATIVGAQQIPANKPSDNSESVSAITPVIEPEWPGQVMLVSDGKLISLEKQALFSEIRTHGIGGLGGGEKVYFVAGTKSNVIAGTTPEFLVRMEVKSDPATVIGMDMVQINVKKKLREVVVASQKGALGGKTSTTTEKFVVLKFTKYGEGSIKFSPVSPLEPGEYMITTTASGSNAYLFRVE
jgi:hypothetical protein